MNLKESAIPSPIAQFLIHHTMLRDSPSPVVASPNVVDPPTPRCHPWKSPGSHPPARAVAEQPQAWKVCHEQGVVCPSCVGPEAIDERLFHLRVHLGRQGLGFDLRGVILLRQLPDMRVHRNGLVLVQGKETGACSHFHAYSWQCTECLLSISILRLAQSVQPLAAAFRLLVEGAYSSGDERCTDGRSEVGAQLLHHALYPHDVVVGAAHEAHQAFQGILAEEPCSWKKRLQLPKPIVGACEFLSKLLHADP
eukprot:scaffold2682_cov344-Pavlova_lutheri.AAC.23